MSQPCESHASRFSINTMYSSNTAHKASRTATTSRLPFQRYIPLSQFQNSDGPDDEANDSFGSDEEVEETNEPSKESEREIHVDQGNLPTYYITCVAYVTD